MTNEPVRINFFSRINRTLYRKFLNSYFIFNSLRVLFYISIENLYQSRLYPFRKVICELAPGRDLKFRNPIFLGPSRTKKESDFFAKNIISLRCIESSLSSSERD